MSDDGSDAQAVRRVNVGEKLQEFWRTRAEWPKERGPYIFLGNAVDLLGKARFAERWVALSDPTLPVAFEQRGIIFDAITDRLATGQMTTYTRAIDGGPYEPITGDIWNTESYRDRFRYCTVNRADPYDRSDDEEDESYIFLNRAEVEALIGTGPTQTLRIDDVDRLPKFLAALVRTADALQLTAESPARPSAFYETKFREVARQIGIEVGLSNRLVEYAGTILRPPGAGRAALKNKSAID